MGQLWSYLTSSTEEETNSYSNSRQQQPSYNSSNTSSSANYSSTSNAYSAGSSSSYPRTESYNGYSDSYNGYQPTHNSTRYGNTIKLYHYTYNDKADKIRQQKKLKASTIDTPQQYRQHGFGVYFTSLGPNVDPETLAQNNFTNGGFTSVPRGVIRKLCSVIEIDFYENEVEKINKRNRDLYIYRDSIDLNDYEGRYKIYRNPNMLYYN